MCNGVSEGRSEVAIGQTHGATLSRRAFDVGGASRRDAPRYPLYTSYATAVLLSLYLETSVLIIRCLRIFIFLFLLPRI